MMSAVDMAIVYFFIKNILKFKTSKVSPLATNNNNNNTNGINRESFVLDA